MQRRLLLLLPPHLPAEFVQRLDMPEAFAGKILVMALGAGLAVWGVINLLEGYGSDNPAAKSQGIKQFMVN